MTKIEYSPGRDPSVYFEEETTEFGRGCRGSLQGVTGLLFHDSVDEDGVISTIQKNLPHNKLGEEERIETQIRLRLHAFASKLKMSFGLLTLALSKYIL